jgi:hypothetical protein
MRNIYFPVLSAVLFMMGIVLVEIGCSNPSIPIPPPSISSSGLLREAKMALSVDETSLKPLKTTNVFKKDSPIIYCSVLLVKAPENTIIGAYMLMVKGEGGRENQKLSSRNIEADGSCYLSFSWNRSGDAWTSGGYNIVVSVNSKEDLIVPFRIE